MCSFKDRHQSCVLEAVERQQGFVVQHTLRADVGDLYRSVQHLKWQLHVSPCTEYKQIQPQTTSAPLSYLQDLQHIYCPRIVGCNAAALGQQALQRALRLHTR